MTPSLRRFVLTAHIVSSVGSLGAVAAFLGLAVAGLVSEDPAVQRGVYLGMELVTWFAVVPFILASLLIGIIQSLGTQWGLFRHYWVVVKLLLTVFVVIVLMLQTGAIGLMASAARDGTWSSTALFEVRLSLVVHAAGGLLVLLVTTALSVYKPRGLTPYGARRWRELHGLPRAE